MYSAVKYSMHIYPSDAKVYAGTFSSADGKAIRTKLHAEDGGYASEAEFAADAKAKGVSGSLCEPSDFKNGACAGKATGMLTSEEYMFGRVNPSETSIVYISEFLKSATKETSKARKRTRRRSKRKEVITPTPSPV